MIVALFTSDYCPTCEEVEGEWEAFVKLHKGEAAFLKVKLSKDTEKMFKALGVSWVPAVIFYDEEEREIKRVEGSFTLMELERAFRASRRRRAALQASR